MKRFANKSKFRSFYGLLQLPGITIQEVLIKDSSVMILAQIKAKYGICPLCGEKSKSIHSTYSRILEDLSISAKVVNIKLNVRKFYCPNPHCTRKIFSQQLLPVVGRYARRTNRPNEQLTQMSLEISAQKSSWFSKLIRIPVSTSTCLRLVNHRVIPIDQEIKHIGIDDWAYRKGISYGTILLDMDQDKVIDLLPGCDGKALKSFLKLHPEIESVCRDRSGTYSAVVNEMIPLAIQVADRFHLVKNLSESVYQVVKSEYTNVVKSLKSPPLKSDPKGTTRQTPGESPEKAATKQKQSKKKGVPNDFRQELFNQVKRLIDQGVGFKTISRHLPISRNTVRKYAGLDVLPNKAIPCKNDYVSYLSTIEQELSKGNILKSIYQIIVAQGFQGSRTAFYEQFRDHPLRDISQSRTLPSGPVTRTACGLSPRRISVYLSFDDLEEIKNKKEHELMTRLLKKSSLLKKLRKQVLSFRKILKAGTPAQLDQWMEEVLKMKRKVLTTFVSGLKRDIKAVWNAITTNWSSGKVEGNVNRLKNIKRQMYGRAGFELLRRKVVLANTG